jgi:hypothetical protein
LQGLLDQVRDGSPGASGGAVYFPYIPGTGNIYLTRGLWVASRTKITADPGVEIRAIGPSLDKRARSNGNPVNDIAASGVFTISSQEGVRPDLAHPMDQIEIAGKFTINANNSIEHALEFNGGTNVTVSDVSLINGTSDNVMFEIRNENNASGNQNANIVLSRCTISSSGRNCISLTWFRWVTITDCNISGAGGFPSCGIDVEPNFSQHPIRGLTVRNCVISFNGAQAILFNPPANGGISTENTDHQIEGNKIFENHFHALHFANGAGQADWKGTVRVIANAITRVNSTSYNAIRNDGWNVVSRPAGKTGYNLIVVGNHLDGYNGLGGEPPIVDSGNWMVGQWP